jgi:7-cyano-7-deazaguanine synthase
MRIQTPLLTMSKAQIIRTGHQLGVDYSKTVSCYQAGPQGEACGECDACRLRKAGFKQAGVSDPTVYQSPPA